MTCGKLLLIRRSIWETSSWVAFASWKLHVYLTVRKWREEKGKNAEMQEKRSYRP